MPDKRTHRGAHPKDSKIFNERNIAGLRDAVNDFSMLLSKGYAEKSSLKLVGDHFNLTSRQRLAVMRAGCSDQQLKSRKARQLGVASVESQDLAIDGYNVLITVEAAISGGVLFAGRDGCYRDLASVHGTYRRVSETIPAVKTIGQFIEKLRIRKVYWLLDSPVSNSGRLKSLLREVAERHNWKWDITLSTNPDAQLVRTETPVASTDSVVLDGCKQWVNLSSEIIRSKIPSAWVVDLREKQR